MDLRLQALKALLQDPGSNLAAVGAAIAIIVVFVVVVALMLIALALPSRKELEESGHAVTTSRRRTGWPGCLIASIIMSVGMVAGVVYWYDATSTDAYCTTTCHAMAEPAATHSASAHRGVACVRCHEGRPWRSFPTGVAARSYSLYLQITGDRPRDVSFDEHTCRQCHTGILRAELTARNGEPFRHTDVLESDTQCRSCHGKQGHEPRRAE